MIDRIIQWFKEYQGTENINETIQLYQKLIIEESDETEKALKNKNLVEYLDWIWDVYWVSVIYNYLNKNYNYIIFDVDYYFKNIWFAWKDKIQTKKEIMFDLINVIADSNFTKSKIKKTWEKKWKIIKGPNFIPPTDWIKKIIEKYKIYWKEN